MLKKRLLFLSQEISGFSSKEKKFILFAMGCVFCISLEYAITRPASTSIFLHYYSAKAFPYAWLFTVPLNLMAVSLYNHFLPRKGCVNIWIFFSLMTVAVNFATFLFIDKLPLFSFFQFVWKDIYVLLMYKQIWSLIHSCVSLNRAKYLYSLIFAMGGIAATCGGIIPSFLATYLGSKQLFIFTLPIYLILFFFYYKAYENSEFNFSLKKDQPLFPGLKTSKYIIWTLLLVIFMQVSIAFIEYQYNFTLEKNFLDTDLRTAFSGKIFTIIHLIMMSLQLFGGILLINFLGLKRIHYLIPSTLIINSILFVFFPSLGLASYIFIYIKSIDFSIFGVLREMLYLPMSIEEKFKAKSLIDVFAYRSAKAFAAFLLLFFEILKIKKGVISIISIIVLISWGLVVRKLFQKEYSKGNI